MPAPRIGPATRAFARSSSPIFPPCTSTSIFTRCLNGLKDDQEFSGSAQPVQPSSQKSRSPPAIANCATSAASSPRKPGGTERENPVACAMDLFRAEGADPYSPRARPHSGRCPGVGREKGQAREVSEGRCPSLVSRLPRAGPLAAVDSGRCPPRRACPGRVCLRLFPVGRSLAKPPARTPGIARLVRLPSRRGPPNKSRISS